MMHYRRLLRSQELTAPKRTGGAVRYQMAHLRVKMLWGSAGQYPCVTCGGVSAEWAYDGTDPTERREGHRLPYSCYPEFYMPMCVLHHRQRDLCGRKRKVLCHH
jgi:hypothetical protein